MPFKTVNDANMYYEIHGQGQPLVCIGGGGADHTTFSSILNELSLQYQVLIFDNRAVGQTTDSGEKFTIEDMANDTIQLIRELQITGELNQGKPHGIGVSMGGLILQALAKDYSNEIDHIVLANTCIKFNENAIKIADELFELYQTLSAPDYAEQSSKYAFSKEFITPEFISLIRKKAVEKQHRQSLTDVKRQSTANRYFDSSEWISSIKNPTLVIGAIDDQIVALDQCKELAHRIPNAKFVSLPGGHVSRVEQANAFLSAILTFLSPSLKSVKQISSSNSAMIAPHTSYFKNVPSPDIQQGVNSPGNAIVFHLEPSEDIHPTMTNTKF